MPAIMRRGGGIDGQRVLNNFAQPHTRQNVFLTVAGIAREIGDGFGIERLRDFFMYQSRVDDGDVEKGSEMRVVVVIVSGVDGRPPADCRKK